MTSREIKAALILKGVSQTSIAKRIGVPVSLVCMVISGKEKTPRVRLAIAAELGKPASAIWPDAKLKKVVGG